MGIDIGHTYALTFAISGALAASCGTLLSTTNGFSPDSFEVLNILAFSVVVLGGLGSVPGALIGGLEFGRIYEFASAYVRPPRHVIVFAILIGALVLSA